MMLYGGLGPYSKPKKDKKMGSGLPKRKKDKLTRRSSMPKGVNLGRLGKGAL